MTSFLYFPGSTRLPVSAIHIICDINSKQHDLGPMCLGIKIYYRTIDRGLLRNLSSVTPDASFS